MTPDERFMGQALGLARRAYGRTSPNPMVGAVLVQKGRVIGRGWHHRAGAPHAEVEALADAARRGHAVQGSTIYVTLEPCCTHGRTPPCTEALVRAGVSRVVVAAIDPNPSHAGQGLDLLRQAGISVESGVLERWMAGSPPLPDQANGSAARAIFCTRIGCGHFVTPSWWGRARCAMIIRG